MKFVLNTSLQDIALGKIVVSLWSQNDVRTLIENLQLSLLSTEWKPIERKVTENVQEVLLPQLLKNKVLGFVMPIGLELSKWTEYSHKYFGVNLPATVCWTPQGTVDKRRTAEVLVTDENLDLPTRYEVACTFCLENDIQFWNMNGDPIFEFWSRNRTRQEIANAHISYKNIFLKCVHENNEVAAAFFLKRLTPQEKQESLVEATKDAATLCLLLREINEDQQIEFIRNNFDIVLRCFLQFPFQSFFIGIVNYMWDFISTDDYDVLLRSIANKFNKNDYIYKNLFREFWQESPSTLKSLIITDLDERGFLPLLFYAEASEEIKIMLKDATLIEKEKFLYSENFECLCVQFILENKWDVLNFCIGELILLLNEGELLKFKSYFEKHTNPFLLKSKKCEWDKVFLFHLSDSSNNRSVEGENCI